LEEAFLNGKAFFILGSLLNKSQIKNSKSQTTNVLIGIWDFKILEFNFPYIYISKERYYLQWNDQHSK